MHNSHFILVNAESKDNAKAIVDCNVMDFGDENNWYSVDNVYQLTNKDDQVHIQECLDDLNRQFTDIEVHKLKKQVKDCYEQEQYGMLSFYSNELDNAFKRNQHKPYTIQNLPYDDEYYAYEYDEFGLTNLISGDFYEDDNNNVKLDDIYFVELDMHS